MKVYYPLLICLTLLSLGCDGVANSINKKDDGIRYVTHHSIIPQKSSWKRAKFKQISYFGRYRSSSDFFHNYLGDPYGPIVGIWQVARHSGEKPDLNDCGKEPQYPDKPKNILRSSPEFGKLEDQWMFKRKAFYSCLEKNTKIEEQATNYSYYYARSTDNYVVVAPKRVEEHALYEINASFGPKIEVSTQGLRPEHISEKDQLYYADCRLLGLKNADKSCYRLPGEDSHLYYNIRSILKNPDKDEFASSYQSMPLITSVPAKWEEIKGIQITKAQYEWLEKRCIEYIFNCYMDETAPELTEGHKAYIKATEWKLDTNYDLRDKLAAEANSYRIHP